VLGKLLLSLAQPLPLVVELRAQHLLSALIQQRVWWWRRRWHREPLSDE
jgi:hypothetical protein